MITQQFSRQITCEYCTYLFVGRGEGGLKLEGIRSGVPPPQKKGGLGGVPSRFVNAVLFKSVIVIPPLLIHCIAQI